MMVGFKMITQFDQRLWFSLIGDHLFGWGPSLIRCHPGLGSWKTQLKTCCYGCDVPVRPLYCFTTNKLFLDQKHDSTIIIQVSYLHCNQRLFLLLNLLLWRVLSNREIPCQALISQHKTHNKENYEIRKWKWRRWTVVAFAKMFKLSLFTRPRKNGPRPPIHNTDVKLAAGHNLGAVSVLRESLPPRTDSSC